MKRNQFLLLLIAFGIGQQLFAQQDTISIQGTVVSKSDQLPLPGATIQLINIKDSASSRYVSTAASGQFNIENLERAFYRLRISSIGYRSFEKLIRLQLKTNNIGVVFLGEEVVEIGEVVVEGTVAPVIQKGDTTQYNAGSFKTNIDASSKDLVKKMPGIEVTSGGVTANGENIEQVLLDGKRFFGQDPLLSLNTIPAEIVDKVQVYDEQSEQSKLTGFDDGNTTKTMNLITKSGKKNGKFGKFYAGFGEDNRYTAGTNINSFNGDRRVTFLAMSNNINLQNFGQEDLAGISDGGGRGGFRRGGNSSFITGEQGGINATNSIGINFTDKIGKKISFEGSYFFNYSENNTEEELVRETYLDEGSQFFEQTENIQTTNQNHRINLRFDYEINEKNKLLLRSSFSSQNSKSDDNILGSSVFSSDTIGLFTDNIFETSNDAFSYSNRLIYQHKFKKIGRTLSAEVDVQNRPTDEDVLFTDNLNVTETNYLTDAAYNEVTPSITYTEPVGSFGQITTKYEYGFARRESDASVFNVDDQQQRRFVQGLSNNFTSDYSYQEPSIGYSVNKLGNSFDVTLAYQAATLKNSSSAESFVENSKKFYTLLPSVSGRFELSSKTRLFARFSTSTTAPSVSQLQNVVDNSSPLFVTIGNSDLDQTYTNSLRFGIRYTNSEKSRTFSNFSNVSNSLNYITNATSVIKSDSTLFQDLYLDRGVQIITPGNANGYWSARNNSTFGFVIKPIKNTANVSVNLGYSRIPAILEDKINYTNSYTGGFKLGLASNISEKIDYNVYYELNGTQVLNSLQTTNSNQYSTQTIATELDFTFKRDFVLRSDTYFQKYSGSNSSFNSLYTLWNVGLAKKFGKNKTTELELSVFDLLGQNQSFSQTVSAQYLQESQTTVLQRYLMLTFTYQFRKFTSK